MSVVVPEHDIQHRQKTGPEGSTDTVAVCGPGRASGAGVPSHWKCPRVWQSGPQKADPGPAPGHLLNLGGGDVGYGLSQVFTIFSQAGKLKNWKSEKLTTRLATRPTRIPDFQDFRFSPAPAAHEILPNEPGRGGGGERPA